MPLIPYGNNPEKPDGWRLECLNGHDWRTMRRAVARPNEPRVFYCLICRYVETYMPPVLDCLHSVPEE